MCFLYFPEALCLLIVYFSFVCMPHAVCLMNTGFVDTTTDIISVNVYPCFFAHNLDFHSVFSNYLLFLNSFLNVIFIPMVFILFTPLVMKWELLIIIKRINKGYVAPTVFISFISLVLICILYLSQQKLFESQQSGKKKLYKSKDIQGTKRTNTQGCRNGARFNKNIFIRWDTFFFDKI